MSPSPERKTQREKIKKAHNLGFHSLAEKNKRALKREREKGRTGVCMVCGLLAINCKCDDRDDWTKIRMGK